MTLELVVVVVVMAAPADVVAVVFVDMGEVENDVFIVVVVITSSYPAA